MGLAGPKIKQRIPADPRNLTWSNDKTQFGYKMLSKMGWSPGKGLGINEDGEKEYIKPSFKQDNLGIGATKKSIDNWLDNSSAFDKLLKGLNDKIQTTEKVEESDEKEKNGRVSEQYNIDDKPKIDKVESKKKKKKKKENGVKNKDKDIISISNLQPSSSLSTVNNISNSRSLYTIRMAHRAKFLKSKKAAVQNSDRLNEIFGIKSSKDSINDCINTGSVSTTKDITISSGFNEESGAENFKDEIGKVDIITKVNGISSHEYFAQKMKGLRISGIRSDGLGKS
uniref:G-patch domain-containing protein n=1 Tax=Rhizophagus irregularis (strain DAOM 181602 / DAOM 197198 / MUCL 43194) TaxID=747089 RepID=U9T7D0_RHIID